MKAPTWVPPYQAITRAPYESPHPGYPPIRLLPGFSMKAPKWETRRPTRL